MYNRSLSVGSLGHTSSKWNSDPHLAALAEVLRGRRPERVLSFGCLQGQECLVLAHMFPRASVCGCDVNDKVLTIARNRCAGSARIFRAEDAKLAEHGPFDVVTAFNMLGRTPAPHHQNAVGPDVSFDQFSQTIALLDRHISPGGVLMLYNAPYFFQDTAAAVRYAPLPTPDMPDFGTVHRHDPGGVRLTRISYVFSDGQELDEVAGNARQALAQQNGLNLEQMGLVTPRLKPLADRATHDLAALVWQKMA